MVKGGVSERRATCLNHEISCHNAAHKNTEMPACAYNVCAAVSSSYTDLAASASPWMIRPRMVPELHPHPPISAQGKNSTLPETEAPACWGWTRLLEYRSKRSSAQKKSSSSSCLRAGCIGVCRFGADNCRPSVPVKSLMV